MRSWKIPTSTHLPCMSLQWEHKTSGPLSLKHWLLGPAQKQQEQIREGSCGRGKEAAKKAAGGGFGRFEMATKASTALFNFSLSYLFLLACYHCQCIFNNQDRQRHVPWAEHWLAYFIGQLVPNLIVCPSGKISWNTNIRIQNLPLL